MSDGTVNGRGQERYEFEASPCNFAATGDASFLRGDSDGDYFEKTEIGQRPSQVYPGHLGCLPLRRSSNRQAISI